MEERVKVVDVEVVWQILVNAEEALMQLPRAIDKQYRKTQVIKVIFSI